MDFVAAGNAKLPPPGELQRMAGLRSIGRWLAPSLLGAPLGAGMKFLTPEPRLNEI